MFPGFYRPRSNFYRLPNGWFALWAAARAARGGGRILAMLKVVEYVIRWSWGCRNFDQPVRLSWHYFQFGRLAGKVRLDRGTGLSSRVLGEALAAAVALGFLERHGDPRRPSYLPHLRPAAGDAAGFAPPNGSYFLVPAIWTDLTRYVSSEALILATEYLFRHTWGWDDGWERPCWLALEEIATGRRYQSVARQGERYDEGIGYSERALRDALADGIKRGWLVWQETEGGSRVCALHLKGMQVAEDGRFLGMASEAADERPPLETPEPELRSSAALMAPAQAASGHLAQLEAQVRALTQEVQALTAAVRAQGTAVTEESEAITEESKAPTADGTADGGGKYSTSYTDTSDTSQTPATDTRGARPVTGGGAGDRLPDDLRRLLADLKFHAGRPVKELTVAYQAEPARIGGWVQHISQHPAEYQNPGGFLLQSVVREGLPLPANTPQTRHGNGARPAGPCPVCSGRGAITLDLPPDDPNHGWVIPCPTCGGQCQPIIPSLARGESPPVAVHCVLRESPPAQQVAADFSRQSPHRRCAEPASSRVSPPDGNG